MTPSSFLRVVLGPTVRIRRPHARKPGPKPNEDVNQVAGRSRGSRHPGGSCERLGGGRAVWEGLEPGLGEGLGGAELHGTVQRDGRDKRALGRHKLRKLVLLAFSVLRLSCTECPSVKGGKVSVSIERCTRADER